MTFKFGIFPSSLTIATVGIFTLSAAVLGCASDVKRAEISASANPTDEVASLDHDIQAGYTAQLDTLAASEFKAAEKGLDKAKSRIKDGDNQAKIIESLSIARGHLNAAREIADGRRAKVQGILDARRAAIAAGARKFPIEKEMLEARDSDFRSMVKDEVIAPEKFSRLQKAYLDLELKAVQTTQLGQVRAVVAQARNDGAKRNVPKTLNRAEIAITTAENKIAANRNNEDDYHDAVNQAKTDATLLVAALAASKRPDGTVASEEVALSLVKEGQTIRGLNENLQNASRAAASKDEVIAGKNAALADQNKKIAAAAVALSLDQALEKGRTEFSKNEAEVYRQGDKLLIRLKAIQFPTGKADLPAIHLALLAKVRNVASDLNPSQVMVEGYTDSTGSAEANQTLSQNRAQAVADYFAHNGLEAEKIEAVGHGFQKPLASNKTKLGRAQNRRVDVVITPANNERQPSGAM